MDQDAVRELARRIIEICAPDELGLFDADADAYFADPARALSGDPVRDKALAGGFVQEIHSLVPVALFLSGHIRELSTDYVIKRSAGRLRDRLRGLRKSPKGVPPGPGLLAAFEVRLIPGDGGSTVGVVAVIADREFGVSVEKATLMMTALVTVASDEEGRVAGDSDTANRGALTRARQAWRRPRRQR
jgi:hypothetical protein